MDGPAQPDADVPGGEAGQDADDPAGGADPAEHVIVQRLDGFPAILRRLEDGTLALSGLDGHPLPALTPGERLRVTRPVSGDATYVQPARVVHVSQDGQHDAVIKPRGDTHRDQQREFVRVVTQPIDVVLATAGDEPDTPGTLRDLSAGGVRAVHDGPALEIGGHVRVRFALPRDGQSTLDLDLDGEVVWAGTIGDGQPAAGIQFEETDDATASKLTAWVFRQESKRLR